LVNGGEFNPSGAAMDTQSLDTFKQARRIDPTLKILPKHHAEMSRRRIRPVSFSRELVFSSMAAGQPVVCTNVPVPVQGQLGTRETVFESLRSGFPKQQTFRVRLGRDGEVRRSLRIDQLLRRWSSDRGLVNITDLHIRGSKLFKSIDCTALSDFNLLAGASYPAGSEEMLTMVISSAGVYTDSHSDSPDGSNHCFVGKKLWLVWDTFEGIAKGLEDVERAEIEGEQATFSISAFLSIPSARWFTVEDGQTLFLPGHLTHKVVTLRDYLGIGSFFCMLPSYWRTLARWTEHAPLFALNARPGERMTLIDLITRLAIRKVRWLAGRPEHERVRWGVSHLVAAVDKWQQSNGPGALATLHPVSAQLVKAVRNFGSETSKAAPPVRRATVRAKHLAAAAEARV
jgi:hypothetical protein